MATDNEKIATAVEGALEQMKKYAPQEFSQMGADPKVIAAITEAARAAAAEEVELAHEFGPRPGVAIRDRLTKYLPEDRIELIEEALSIPTFSMGINQTSVGKYWVHLTREAEEFLPGRELSTVADIDWAKFLQYASIVVEAIMLAMQAVGVKVSVSASIMKATINEAAQQMRSSSVFQNAIQAFISAWKKAGGSTWAKAKAIFVLLKESMAAGLLWIIIKSLCQNMSGWDWIKTGAKVAAMIIASLASGGAALIAKIALAVMDTATLAQKIANVVQLEDIEKSF